MQNSMMMQGHVVAVCVVLAVLEVSTLDSQCTLSSDGCIYKLSVAGETCTRDSCSRVLKDFLLRKSKSEKLAQTMLADDNGQMERVVEDVADETSIDKELGRTSNSYRSIKHATNRKQRTRMRGRYRNLKTSHPLRQWERVKRNNDPKKPDALGKKQFRGMILREMEKYHNRLYWKIDNINKATDDILAAVLKQPVHPAIVKPKPKTVKCRSRFVGVDNWPSCYMFSKFAAGWYEARQFCNAFDANLVALSTSREHHILAFIIRNEIESTAAKGWWTSGSYVTKTRQWVWTSQLFFHPLTFEKWVKGHPNVTNSQCVHMSVSDGLLWKEDMCSKPYHFICEAGASDDW